MFSANENLALRQHKKRVVEYVEACIPEEALDLGTMVMVMQVSCKAPGCVPLETAIVIVFPKLGKDEELIPGLPESCGGNYKTKVLKPMSEVNKEDVLDSLPPQFLGGRRSMEKLCIQARDVMLGQITQLFSEEDQAGRFVMAEYLQQCLREYVNRDCTPPEWGEPYPPLVTEEKAVEVVQESITATGNFVFRRPVDDEGPAERDSDSLQGMLGMIPSVSRLTLPNYSNAVPFKPNNVKAVNEKSTQSIMQQLGERQHAPGIRKPGCLCCDPDNLDSLVDQMLAR